jgi:prevent-host-death family protein
MYASKGGAMEINAAEFRTKCFKILAQVSSTHREVIITKRGKPIAKIVHIDQTDKKDPMLGVLSGCGRTLADLTQPVVDSDVWEID